VLMRISTGKLDVREIQSPLIGKPAPSFALPSVVDPSKVVDSKSLKGRMYLFNVWGTWCGGCREEHSALVTIARTGGVPIIGLDWKDDRDQAAGYLAQLGNPYTEVASDADGRVAIDWGVYGAPETFLVSADGVILQKHIGEITDAIWREKFQPLVMKGARP
jgi:cytochrome c biogenesis protein CcmG, thiol:disulfide interchange protein DsbE